jgi:hypothetical protein
MRNHGTVHHAHHGVGQTFAGIYVSQLLAYRDLDHEVRQREHDLRRGGSRRAAGRGYDGEAIVHSPEY